MAVRRIVAGDCGKLGIFRLSNFAKLCFFTIKFKLIIRIHRLRDRLRIGLEISWPILKRLISSLVFLPLQLPQRS